jgi:hypothetical protein
VIASATASTCGSAQSRTEDVAPRLEPGGYLVAIDTPTRTYLDYVKLDHPGPVHPSVNGWPLLARWEHQQTALAVRSIRFVPGQTLSALEIQSLLPITAPAERSLDITAAPFSASPSPSDSTRSIQAALDAAQSMATAGHPVDVVVPPARFDHSGPLLVGANVHLRGAGGELHATNADTSAVRLVGDGSAALFLKVTSTATSRSTSYRASGIWVGPESPHGNFVHDTLVIGNEIFQSENAHVIAEAEVGGIWAFNYAHGGYADFFHHTSASSECQVVGNRASGTSTRGDDFYAFVGYAKDGDPVNHCACLANWGREGPARGVSAVGAAFLDIRGNDLARTQAAGIYVARERSYNTYGSFDVTIAGNRVAEANLGLTHDGLLAYADEPTDRIPSRSFAMVPNAVRNLFVLQNSFVDISPGKGNGFGIEIRASASHGTVMDNAVQNPNGPGIVVLGDGFTVSGNTTSAK